MKKFCEENQGVHLWTQGLSGATYSGCASPDIALDDDQHRSGCER